MELSNTINNDDVSVDLSSGINSVNDSNDDSIILMQTKKLDKNIISC